MPGTNLHQQLIEEYPVDAALASGRVDIRWQTKAIGLEHNDIDGAITRPCCWTRPQASTGRCALIVAADGGRSSPRRQLGCASRGQRLFGTLVITDIKADIDLPTERLCHFDPAWNPGNNVLVHRQPNGIWRLTTDCPTMNRPSRRSSLVDWPSASTRSQMIGQLVPWEIDWRLSTRPIR
ncbi:MAG: FAD-dependent monooxygenase [Burkholderiaceae bacterium]